MFELINKQVSMETDFTNNELLLFNELLTFKKIPKKTLMLKEGETCTFEAFINKGCIRKYYINENGNEVTIQFGIESWWISDMASFYEQLPSKVFIETLEESEVLLLNNETKAKLLYKVPKFERVFRLLVQRNLCSTQNRLIESYTKSAKDKYLDFLIKYPTIPNRVPQHYIASYLGISAEFLSKIRTKLNKNSSL